MDQGLDVNSVGAELSFTPLIEVCWRGSLKIVKLLLERGAHLNSVDKFGRSALMGACHRGHVEVVKLLLERHSDVNAMNENGDTALMSCLL